MQTHLYLLVHADKPKFKIGIGYDPVLRSKQLSQRINYAKSSAYSFAERQRAYDAEKILHRLFRPHAKPEEKGKTGFSEWFSMDAFHRAMSFLESQQELLGYERVEPVTLPAQPARPARQKKAAEQILKKVQQHKIYRGICGEHLESLEEQYFQLKQKFEQLKQLLLQITIHTEYADAKEDIFKSDRLFVATGKCDPITKLTAIWNDMDRVNSIPYLVVYDRDVTDILKQGIVIEKGRSFSFKGLQTRFVAGSCLSTDENNDTGIYWCRIQFPLLCEILTNKSPTPYAEEIAELFFSIVDQDPLPFADRKFSW